MAETLTLRATLKGHVNWVTSIATPLDPSSNTLLSSSRYVHNISDCSPNLTPFFYSCKAARFQLRGFSDDLDHLVYHEHNLHPRSLSQMPLLFLNFQEHLECAAPFLFQERLSLNWIII